MRIPIFTFILCFFSCNFIVKAQNEVLKNKVFNPDIKTVEIYKKGFRFAYPIIRLNSGEQIILEFDDLNINSANYAYTIIHCNSDFTPSDLNPIEYIEGYEENTLNDYESSFNTAGQYNHYSLEIPNADIQPKLSGNYILLIYEDYDTEKPVLQRRFSVADEKITISGKTMRSAVVSSLKQAQELSFTLIDNTGYIQNPIDNLFVTVSQNNRADRQLTGLKPDFINGKNYEFINPRRLMFEGGNEFRYFNTKTYKYTNDRVAAVRYEKPYYIFTLIPDKSEANLPYTYVQDINGDFLITAENVEDADTEAEYVLVDFTLRYPKITDEAGFYVFGALTDWELSEKNKMTYNYTSEAYELRLKLKQGFYNYEYVYADTANPQADHARIEGNFAETENNYVIYVYYRSPGKYYDELIGTQVINTIRKDN